MIARARSPHCAAPAAPAPRALRATRALHPKLAVGPADDAYEREADAVAARITAMPGLGGEPAGQPEATPSVSAEAGPMIRRQPASLSAPVIEQPRPLITTWEVDTKTDAQKLGKGA